jgi:uridine kinase
VIFNRKVAEAAASIAERAGQSRAVFLSGPSGSGKTTTAKKICDALKKMGVIAHTVSLDKYYITVDLETAPRTEDGEMDLESPDCLDLELLGNHVEILEHGEEVMIPHFDFKTQAQLPSRFTPLKLEQNEVVIFEGIHALSDLLTHKHPNAFKLYISARSDVERDGSVFFKRTWTRLLRRVVRDELFRGKGATDTLKLWAIVREGEKKYISPYKYKADLLFDSSMEYEIPVMKRFALSAFSAVPEGADRMEELVSLLPILKQFNEISEEAVPPDSILREFIGGGRYEY